MLAALLGFLGGLGIFLYGTNVLSNALQQLGANKMRNYLATISDKRWKTVLSGMVVAFFLQSSTVSNIIVVGLVSSTIISLAQAFGIVLGSAIGTTFTVQILTFDIAEYSAIFIFIGVIFSVFMRNARLQTIGKIILSIGFIFFGIGLITSAMEPLTKLDGVLQFLIQLSNKPVLFLIVAAFLTAIMHSSAAVIIIGIAFISTGTLTFHSVIPLVLGANIGATFPVIISSLTSKLEGKKLAVFYFLFKTIGVLLLYPFILFVSDWIDLLPGNAERQVANFHTLFNVIIVLIFYPFIGWIALLFRKVFSQKEKDRFTVHIDDALLNVPDEALYHSKNEVVRLGEMIQKEMVLPLRQYTDGEIGVDGMYEAEDIVDASYIELQAFLLQLGQRNLTNEQSTEEVKLLNVLNDMEHIGDAVVIFLQESTIAREKNIQLQAEDIALLNQLLSYIEQTYENSLRAFEHNDFDLAKENLKLQAEITQFEKDIKFNHFSSLIHNKEYNPDISAVYLDTINQLFQIYNYCMNISRTVLGMI